MEPQRLPRPGQALETCRLCSQPLDVSTENPRRVCANCGEVNLPTDGAEIIPMPAARAPTGPVFRRGFAPRHSEPEEDDEDEPTKTERPVVVLLALPGMVSAVWTGTKVPWTRGGILGPWLDLGFYGALSYVGLLPVGFTLAAVVAGIAGEFSTNTFVPPALRGMAIGLLLGAGYLMARSFFA